MATSPQISDLIFQQNIAAPTLPPRERTLRYIGSVTRTTNERVLTNIGKLLDKNADEEIGLLVTSPGGTTGTAMSFYDTVRYVLKPNLVTIASGEIDSSGMIIFLSGNTRYVTERTTALLHMAGRFFGNQRYTTDEMAAMLAEDRLKDEQYATILAHNSRGALSKEDVLKRMRAQTVLSPQDLIRYNLADTVLP